MAIKLVTRVFEKIQFAKRALREITLLRHFSHHGNITGLIDLDAISPDFNEMCVPFTLSCPTLLMISAAIYSWRCGLTCLFEWIMINFALQPMEGDSVSVSDLCLPSLTYKPLQLTSIKSSDQVKLLRMNMCNILPIRFFEVDGLHINSLLSSFMSTKG